MHGLISIGISHSQICRNYIWATIVLTDPCSSGKALPSPGGFGLIPHGHHHMLAALAPYTEPGLTMALQTHCLNTIEHQKPLPKLAVARREGNDRETQKAETLGVFHRAGIYEVLS